MGDEPANHGEQPSALVTETVPDGLVKKEVQSDTEKADTAAVQVQRLYRGYRTRRNIADAAVMAQKFGWWNVVDGAMLHHNSSQFYAYSKPQNAAQRWVRLKRKAAKVGKGLSQNEQARKLALQHWLEAIDPRHRYGHNLHFYYEAWCNSNTQEPFFYWLDVGEGKDLELEKCKKSKLQNEQISYLSPKERKWFEVLIEDGKLVYKMTEKPVDTPKGEKWIFVMSTSGKLYVGKKEKGKLQHSSFLAGGATIAAGRLLVRNGTIELMEAHSGHYHPTPDNFKELITILTDSGADLTMAKVQYTTEDLLPSSGSANSRSGTGGISHQETIEEDVLDDELQSMILADNQNASNAGEVEPIEATDAVDSKTTFVGSGKPNKLDRSLSKMTPKEIESLKGFRLEIMQPARASSQLQSEQDEKAVEKAIEAVCDRAAPDSPSPRPPFVHNKHKLFGPAMRTFSRLDIDYCTRAVQEHEAQKPQSELNPNTKRHLIRRLSMSRPVVSPT
ncbi:hypothetical protein AXG93_523s1200 [Marchantia polymorpha subsp. ruderalis]|uniref:Uncharacterized protein n=1 Tax=Marchantia polymorpha subsp. ruderalis TaxID=1480154 RepID=A0A176VXY9_MARPO|nr:hypothetical protein AXG93_523s1200 [Marchantia polymorpha subsp. ruderalis]